MFAEAGFSLLTEREVTRVRTIFLTGRPTLTSFIFCFSLAFYFRFLLLLLLLFFFLLLLDLRVAFFMIVVKYRQTFRQHIISPRGHHRASNPKWVKFRGRNRSEIPYSFILKNTPISARLHWPHHKLTFTNGHKWLDFRI